MIEAEAGQRKHELAEEPLPQDPKFRGLFLVITGNAPAPVWRSNATPGTRSSKCSIGASSRT